MPIYEYGCQSCSHVFEQLQRNHDDCEIACPVCNQKTRRLISNTSFVLKGSGWYVTDYPKDKKTPDATASKKTTDTPKTGADKTSDTSAQTSAEKSASPDNAGNAASSAPPKATADTSAATAA